MASCTQGLPGRGSGTQGLPRPVQLPRGPGLCPTFAAEVHKPRMTAGPRPLGPSLVQHRNASPASSPLPLSLCGAPAHPTSHLPGAATTLPSHPACIAGLFSLLPHHLSVSSQFLTLTRLCISCSFTGTLASDPELSSSGPFGRAADLMAPCGHPTLLVTQWACGAGRPGARRALFSPYLSFPSGKLGELGHRLDWPVAPGTDEAPCGASPQALLTRRPAQCGQIPTAWGLASSSPGPRAQDMAVGSGSGSPGSSGWTVLSHPELHAEPGTGGARTRWWGRLSVVGCCGPRSTRHAGAEVTGAEGAQELRGRADCAVASGWQGLERQTSAFSAWRPDTETERQSGSFQGTGPASPPAPAAPGPLPLAAGWTLLPPAPSEVSLLSCKELAIGWKARPGPG